MPPVAEVSRFLAVLALVAGPGSLVLLALRRRPSLAPLRTHATAAAAAVAMTATAGSLWYSEVAGFVPCELCWFQRIAMYPLAVVLPMAVLRRDLAVRPYARALAGIGLVVSVWHVALQRLPVLSGASTCAVDVPCATRWVEVFGFLTIPTMAASGFVAIIVLTSLRPATATPATTTPATTTPATTTRTGSSTSRP